MSVIAILGAGPGMGRAIAKTFDGHVHEALQYGGLECGSTEAKFRARKIERDLRERLESNRQAKRYDPLRRGRR